MAKKAIHGDEASALIDEYIAERADWRGELLAEIRSVFRAAEDGVTEEWKWMGSPVWSHHGVLAVANAHKAKVKVTFASGAALEDSGGVFNAGLDGNRWRAIDLHEGESIDPVALTALVREAIAHNVSER